MRKSLLAFLMSAACAGAQNCPTPVHLPSQYTSLGVSFTLDDATDERQMDQKWLISWAGDKQGLISMDGKHIIEPVYDEIDADWHEGFLLVRQQDKWGLLDHSGKEVIAPTFAQVWAFRQGVAAVSISGERLDRLIDKTGKTLFVLEDGEIVDIGEKLITIKKDGRYGFVNDHGEMQIAPQYDSAFHFVKDRAVVGRQTAGGTFLEGVIDEQGREILPLEYYSVSPSPDGYFLASDAESKVSVFDRDGKRIISPEYDFVGIDDGDAGAGINAFSDGLTAVSKGQYWGVVDNQGKEILALKYGLVQILENGLILALLDGKYGVFNRQGDTLIPFDYEYLRYDADGQVFIFSQHVADEHSRKNDASVEYMGILDSAGRVKIPAQYQSIYPSLSGERYIAQKEEKFLLLDKTGKSLSDERWDLIAEGVLDMLEVARDEGFGYINKNGEIIVKPQYEYVSSIGKNLALVNNHKHSQLLDISSGCVLIDMEENWKN